MAPAQLAANVNTEEIHCFNHKRNFGLSCMNHMDFTNIIMILRQFMIFYPKIISWRGGGGGGGDGAGTKCAPNQTFGGFNLALFTGN